jgi:hypothetical protein
MNEPMTGVSNIYVPNGVPTCNHLGSRFTSPQVKTSQYTGCGDSSCGDDDNNNNNNNNNKKKKKKKKKKEEDDDNDK